MKQNIDFELIQSEVYKDYMKALALYTRGYVPRIRCKFAAKAEEMYHNETVRKLVLAYGREYEKRELDYICNFKRTVDNFEPELIETMEESFEDSCLNKAASYGDAIKLLFGI